MSSPLLSRCHIEHMLSTGADRRGMAAHMGKDVSKLKAKGGGKWKYMSEADMLALSEKYAPYRFVLLLWPGP